MKYVFEFLIAIVSFFVVIAIAFVLSSLLWGLVIKLICWVTGITFNFIVPAIIGLITVCVNTIKNNVWGKAMSLAEKIVEG